MKRYYVRASGLGPMRAIAVLCTDRGWFFTICMQARRVFGSRSEAKRALRWAHENGYDSARICEEP